MCLVIYTAYIAIYVNKQFVGTAVGEIEIHAPCRTSLIGEPADLVSMYWGKARLYMLCTSYTYTDTNLHITKNANTYEPMNDPEA